MMENITMFAVNYVATYVDIASQLLSLNLSKHLMLQLVALCIYVFECYESDLYLITRVTINKQLHAG